MTSIEMVDFINSEREAQAKQAGQPFPSGGFAKLEHADFLKKVPIVLGVSVAGNFSGYYKASNGKSNPMYTFPKREACLMAMSYSYELQAKVFDRMTALEEKVAGQQFEVPKTLSTALRLAAAQAEQIEQQQAIPHRLSQSRHAAFLAGRPCAGITRMAWRGTWGILSDHR